MLLCVVDYMSVFLIHRSPYITFAGQINLYTKVIEKGLEKNVKNEMETLCRFKADVK